MLFRSPNKQRFNKQWSKAVKTTQTVAEKLAARGIATQGTPTEQFNRLMQAVTADKAPP